ncbi:MAG TPA: lipase family protein [Candidatus Avacidaminococcus intestinavium]|uniref:Lipase family protein n=1 Tax=Candidatus Avacidaminococcus intestinavium TaxID=2840684 RepID=A0A9D1MQB8_9FIRM|nr:lipase family protein [Candidatus Avacidaminococcus intestinavium]
MLKKIFLIIGLFVCLLGISNRAIAAASQEVLAERLAETKLIALAAGACSSSYGNSDASPENAYLRKYNFSVKAYTVADGNSQANFILARNTNFDGQKLYILAFRGSASKEDWMTNFASSKVPYRQGELSGVRQKVAPNEPAVHRGFNNYVNAVLAMKETVLDNAFGVDLWKEINENPRASLLLTGHSMGGAVATLLAERLIDLGVSADKVKVITFGAPAIGNSAFADEYGARINLLRIKTDFDPVPGSLQTFVGGFKQFGQEEKFRLSGRVSAYQHPVSYYLDLAVKNYFDELDELIDVGFINPTPRQVLTAEAPIVAIYPVRGVNAPEQTYGKYMSRFLVEEYLTFIPNYIVLGEVNGKPAEIAPTFKELMQQARAVQAEYILYLDIDAKRVGQEDKWYITLVQSLFDNKGNLITASSFGRRLTYEQGYVQCSLSNLDQGFESLHSLLPWIEVQEERRPGGTNENY